MSGVRCYVVDNIHLHRELSVPTYIQVGLYFSLRRLRLGRTRPPGLLEIVLDDGGHVLGNLVSAVGAHFVLSIATFYVLFNDYRSVQPSIHSMYWDNQFKILPL